jgi:hypothetical protein
MATIIITLKADRKSVGKLFLYKKNGDLMFSAPSLGRADENIASNHGNPLALSTKLYGHTPTGVYQSDNSVIPSGPNTPYNEDSYGAKGIIWLDPQSGVALTAKNNGRTGLAIHGGKPGSQGKLRPTNGCVRLSNPDMEQFINDVKFLFMQGDNIKSITVEEALTPLPDLGTSDLLATSNDPDPFPYS